MSFVVPLPDDRRDLRGAKRTLCAGDPAESWRRADEARAYPEHHLDLVEKGCWLGALTSLACIGEHTLGLPRS
jgi:hypothetical protein